MVEPQNLTSSCYIAELVSYLFFWRITDHRFFKQNFMRSFSKIFAQKYAIMLSSKGRMIIMKDEEGKRR